MNILMSKSNSKGTRVVIKYDFLHIADYMENFDHIQFGTIYSGFSNYNNYDLASNDNVGLKVYARMVNISGGVVIPININNLRVRVTNDKFNYHDFKGENGFIFVTKNNIDEIYNGNKEAAMKNALLFVKDLDNIVQGNVFSVSVYSKYNENMEESIWNIIHGCSDRDTFLDYIKDTYFENCYEIAAILEDMKKPEITTYQELWNELDTGNFTQDMKLINRSSVWGYELFGNGIYVKYNNDNTYNVTFIDDILTSIKFTKTNGDIFVKITNGKFVTERSINTKILVEDIGIKNIKKLKELFY